MSGLVRVDQTEFICSPVNQWDVDKYRQPLEGEVSNECSESLPSHDLLTNRWILRNHMQVALDFLSLADQEKPFIQKMGETASRFEELPLQGSPSKMEFLHGFDGQFVEESTKLLKITKPWDERLTTVEDDSGTVLFNLRKDPLSTNEETEMLDEKGKIIATCERERLEKTAYITVKENGTKLAVATITRLIRQKENTLYLYIHSPRVTLEDAKKTYFQRIQPALYIEGGNQSFDIVAGDIKTDPVKLAKVTYCKDGTNREEMKKQMRQGGALRQAGKDKAQIFVYVGRNVDFAFMVLLANLLDEIFDAGDA